MLQSLEGEKKITHGELSQLVPPAGAPEGEELCDRVIKVEQHHLGGLAEWHPLIQ